MDTTSWDLAGRFLAALAERDFDALGELLDPQLTFRALVPSGFLSHQSAEEATGCFRRWFGARDGFCLVDASVGEIGSRTYLRYRISVAAADDPHATEQVEQHLFVAAGAQITALDLMCSGFRRDAAPDACRVAR